jgi:hypothetical protein
VHAANAIRLDAHFDAAFRSALIRRIIADLVARFSYKGIADHRLTTETPQTNGDKDRRSRANFIACGALADERNSGGSIRADSSIALCAL